MSEDSKNEVLQKYIRALGEEFGREHHAVWSQWCSALNRHDDLLELFGTREKVDVLNAVAPTFFADVQGLFWNDLVLRVSRLTDTAGGSLRLESLERRLTKEDPVDSLLLADVRRHREAAVATAEPVTAWRNKRIAHHDRALALGESGPLGKVTLGTCKEVLDHVHAALSAIELSRTGSATANMVVSIPSASALVGNLQGFLGGAHFVASLINPESPTETDRARAKALLRGAGRSERHAIDKLHRLVSAARLRSPE